MRHTTEREEEIKVDELNKLIDDLSGGKITKEDCQREITKIQGWGFNYNSRNVITAATTARREAERQGE